MKIPGLSLLPLGKRLKSFCRRDEGIVPVMFALAVIPLIGLTGVAFDYSTANQTKATLQSIADSAALSGATAAKYDTDQVRKERAETWLTNLAAESNITLATRNVTVANGEVNVEASTVNRSKLGVLNFGDLTIGVKSVAMLTQEPLRKVLDVAMCIDATGSMQNTIDSVKARAKSFEADLNTAIKARGYESFDYMRVRVIFYRDFAVDNGQWTYYHYYGWYQNPLPMVKSDFYAQPSKKTDLETFIGSQSARGGGDLPESGYECIHEGMKSVWFKPGDPIPSTSYKADQVYPAIILWSDADALPFNHSNSVNAALYPADMPRSAGDFSKKWGDPTVIDQSNKLLVQFGLCNNSSWSTARSLAGYMCGGSLTDGNSNMINKIADAMTARYQNKLTRLKR